MLRYGANMNKNWDFKSAIDVVKNKSWDFKSAIDVVFKITTALFCFSTSFFLIAFTIRRYIYPFMPDVPVADGILDKISNETMLAVLALLVSFAGLMAYIFQTLIRSSIKDELLKITEQDSLAARADSLKSEAGALSYFYFYNNNPDNNFLDKLVKLAEKALHSASQLETKDKDLCVLRGKCENNLAFFMAASAFILKLDGPKYQLYKTKAMFLSEKNLVRTKNDNMNSEKDYRHFCTARATRAIAMMAFSEGDDTKIKEARELFRTMRKDTKMSAEALEEAAHYWKRIFKENPDGTKLIPPYPMLSPQA